MDTLTPEDKRVLAALAETPSELATLDSELDLEASQLRDRLSFLIEAGLVATVSDETFVLTQSGQRILGSTSEYSADEGAYLHSEIQQTLDGFDLRRDRKRAVRSAYLFLKYWDDATAAEIAEAIYREHPAEYTSPTGWWENCVRQYLATLQTVAPPEADLLWHYTGQIDEDHTKNGRHGSGNYGSVRHAIEHLSYTDRETRAIRAAFAHLYFQESCSKRDLMDTVYPEYPAGYDSAEDWWGTCIRDALEELPGVKRVNASHEWKYSFDFSSGGSPSEPG